jgi:hypothetical protein
MRVLSSWFLSNVGMSRWQPVCRSIPIAYVDCLFEPRTLNYTPHYTGVLRNNSGCKRPRGRLPQFLRHMDNETTFALHGSESPTDAHGCSQRTPNIPPSTLLIGGRSSSQSARPRRPLRTDLGARATAHGGRSSSRSREKSFRDLGRTFETYEVHV